MSGLLQLTPSIGYILVRYDFGTLSTDPIYVGYSVPGTSQASASWTIKRITLDSGGNPQKEEWTVRWTAIWDNRSSETYF